MDENLSNYCHKGYKEVDGWLYRKSVKCAIELSDLQKSNGIKGNICEIGIHHGKFFILLHLLTDKDEYSIACDLFEKQDENLSRSGRGDREIFIENLNKHGGDLERVQIISVNSLNLNPEDLTVHGGIRMFSVDGGHDADTAYNDIKLAVETIVDGGLIIVDDFFHEGWPAVSEGVYRYIFETDGNLWPVIIVDEKFILTNNEQMANKYIDSFLEKFSLTFELKISQILGKRVVIIMQEDSISIKRYLARTRMWGKIRNHRLGNIIRRITKNI